MPESNGGFSVTQTKILEVLSDGRVHTRQELAVCLPDDRAVDVTLRVHMHHIRKHLRPRGQDIVFVNNGPGIHGYMHVRLLASPSTE